MIKTAFALALGVAIAVPAAAQDTQRPSDEKQCTEEFAAADLDNNGSLSKAEIGAAKSKLPASVGNKDNVSREEFMGVCGKRAS